jgi:hypothetical protein
MIALTRPVELHVWVSPNWPSTVTWVLGRDSDEPPPCQGPPVTADERVELVWVALQDMTLGELERLLRRLRESVGIPRN